MEMQTNVVFFYYIKFEVIRVTNLNNHYAKSGSLKRDAPFESLTGLRLILYK
jgi:hypothetical protein